MKYFVCIAVTSATLLELGLLLSTGPRVLSHRVLFGAISLLYYINLTGGRLTRSQGQVKGHVNGSGATPAVTPTPGTSGGGATGPIPGTSGEATSTSAKDKDL